MSEVAVVNVAVIEFHGVEHGFDWSERDGARKSRAGHDVDLPRPQWIITGERGASASGACTSRHYIVDGGWV